jgi:hypothetical protein
MFEHFLDWVNIIPDDKNELENGTNTNILETFMIHAKPGEYIYLNDLTPSDNRGLISTKIMRSTGRFFVVLPQRNNSKILVLWRFGVIRTKETIGGVEKTYYQLLRDFTSHNHNNIKFEKRETPIDLVIDRSFISRIETILGIRNGKLEHFTESKDIRHTAEDYQAIDAILFRSLKDFIVEQFVSNISGKLLLGMLQKSKNNIIKPSVKNATGEPMNPAFDREKLFWKDSTHETGNGPVFESGSQWHTPDLIKKIISHKADYDKNAKRTYLTWVNQNTHQIPYDCFLMTTYSPGNNFDANQSEKWGFHIIVDLIYDWGVFGAAKPKDALDELLENKHTGYMPLYELVGQLREEEDKKFKKNEIQRSCIYGVRELDVIHTLLTLTHINQENSTHYSIVTSTGNPDLHFLYFSATEIVDGVKTCVVMRAECRDGKPNLKRKDLIMFVKDRLALAQSKLTQVAQLQGYMAIGNSNYDSRMKAYGGIPPSWMFQANGLVTRHLMRYTICDAFTTTPKRVPGSDDDDLRADKPYVDNLKKLIYITSKDFKQLLNVYSGESQGDLRNRIHLAKKTTTA